MSIERVNKYKRHAIVLLNYGLEKSFIFRFLALFHLVLVPNQIYPRLGTF